MSPSRCAVGLLTLNGQADAARCARSLLAQTETGVEIRWIDNASSDATIRRVREGAAEFPDPIVMERNVGFCEGHNRAFAATRAPYYLALNQDVFLAEDYIEKLCDWMDSEPKLAAASGLILNTGGVERLDPGATIYSAGMAMSRNRFPFEMRMGRPVRDEDRGRRFVPAATGAALLVRRSAIEAVSPVPHQIFPPEMFAYFEEVDLALRLARAGLRCGIHGEALAWHAARGQEGRSDPSVRAHYLKNHWLVTLRNDSWGQIARELPYILKGELTHYFRRYLRSPLQTLRAVGLVVGQLSNARRSYRWMEEHFPSAKGRGGGRREFYELSRKILRVEDGG